MVIVLSVKVLHQKLAVLLSSKPFRDTDIEVVSMGLWDNNMDLLAPSGVESS
jgi:hypothetical protein